MENEAGVGEVVPPIRYRRLDLDIPRPVYDRLEKALGDVIQKGLLPAGTGVRDFILATVLVNGLALVESDLKQRERQTRLILSPDEAAQAQKELQRVAKVMPR